MDSILFNAVPRSILFFVSLAGALVSFELGFAIGKRRQSRNSDEEKNVSPMVAGVLGLVAFILALTFSLAVNRFDQRRQNVLSDANAISTAYLRAYLVADPQGARIRQLLDEYTDLRAHFLDVGGARTLQDKVQALQSDIWKQVIALSRASPGPSTASLAAMLNEVFDLHEKRVNDAIYSRFGSNVWIVLISIVLLGMLMLGVQNGLTGKKSLIGLFPFAFALSAMITLIADLDHPQAGMFVVSQQPMLDTLASIRSFDSSLGEKISPAP